MYFSALSHLLMRNLPCSTQQLKKVRLADQVEQNLCQKCLLQWKKIDFCAILREIYLIVKI